MLDKLEAIKARFEQLGVALTNPEIVNDNKKFAATSKEYRSLEKIVNAHDEYKKVLGDIEFYKEALSGMTKNCVNWQRTKRRIWRRGRKNWSPIYVNC
jgi:protein subunit release factor A